MNKSTKHSKMTYVGFVTIGHSNYVDPIWDWLNKHRKLFECDTDKDIPVDWEWEMSSYNHINAFGTLMLVGCTILAEIEDEESIPPEYLDDATRCFKITCPFTIDKLIEKLNDLWIYSERNRAITGQAMEGVSR